MSQRVTDFTSYKGVLPYSTELFGVYQPLLGWRGRRFVRRIDRGRYRRRADVLRQISSSVQPIVDVRFAVNECTLEIGRLLPGASNDGPGSTSIVIKAIAAKLPPKDNYEESIWEQNLSPQSLQQLLDGPVKKAAQELYARLCNEARGAKQQAEARSATEKFLAAESRTAGVLTILKDNHQYGQLHELFYGAKASSFSSVFDLMLKSADPFDTIDPTHVLDRVGLSPIGIAHLFRQYFFELDTFLGPPVGHVWIAPGSTVELIEVHTRRIYQEERLEKSIDTLQRTEKSLTTSDELADAIKEDNRSGINLGVSVGVNEQWGWGNANESASFGLENTQEHSREQAHTVKREQSEKLTTEIKQNFKSTFRTVTETTDTSTKRYVLGNQTNKLLNYELRRKMRQVEVQVQDVGSYLCWQTYVDDPARELGLAKLVHVAAPPDLSKIPEPEEIVPPEAFGQPVPLSIPFLDEGDGAENTETYEAGEEVSLGALDQVNHIVWQFNQGPFHCSKASYTLKSVAIDVQGADAIVTADQIKGDQDSGYSFVTSLNHVNFNEQNSINIMATLFWDPMINEAAIKAENDKQIALFTAREREKFRSAFLVAAQERIKLASNIAPRKFEDLRHEERITIYRKLIQDLLTPSTLVPQPDKQTQHTIAELINSIFDVEKMLYFVAPEFWRPRLHHSHQQLGGVDTLTDAVTGEQVGYNSFIPPNDVTAWGEADVRKDSYYITGDSTPARLGSSLGWLLQLDGDNLRNAFLNAPWVKAILPIRPAKEKAALSWLKHVEGMGTLTPNDLYAGPEPEWTGKTIFEVLDILAEKVAEKHAEALTTKEYQDPLDDSNTVRATPLDRVYEHGFDPVDGFRAKVDGNFEIFDQWLEILPTDQVVAVEVTYDPKTGRQL